MISLIVLSLVLVGCKDTSLTGDVVASDAVIGCKDSDGGLDKAVKGIVSSGDDERADSCVSGLLIEYYCDGNNIANQNIRCANKCSNGKCA